MYYNSIVYVRGKIKNIHWVKENNFVIKIADTTGKIKVFSKRLLIKIGKEINAVGGFKRKIEANRVLQISFYKIKT